MNQWILKSELKLYIEDPLRQKNENLKEICKVSAEKYNIPTDDISFCIDHEKVTISVNTISENKALPIIAVLENCSYLLYPIRIFKKELKFGCKEKKGNKKEKN